MNQKVEQALIDYSNDVWDRAMKAGALAEQERIINVLTNFDNTKYLKWLENSEADWVADYWNVAGGVRLAVELIKGEIN